MNPFSKRSTEYYRDDGAFISVVTPEPLNAFFARPAKEDALYDRLVAVIGTPGCGKTTIARLFHYPVIAALLKQGDAEPLRALRDALTECKAIEGEEPLLAGWRLPMEAEYRDFWELPYPEDIRFNLMRAMIQARAVLGWLRSLDPNGDLLERIRFTARTDSQAAAESIGGTTGPGLQRRAQEVERAIYKVSAALVAPDIGNIDAAALSAYRPFDVISEIVVQEDNRTRTLRPLLILDDAHTLHRQQFQETVKWLVEREIRVSRWILCRLDALSASNVLLGSDDEASEQTLPGVQRGRDITLVRLQAGVGESRAKEKREWRSMAQGMANRLLAQMPTFSRRQINAFPRLLEEVAEPLSPSSLKRLEKVIETKRTKLKIRPQAMQLLEQEVASYLSGTESEDKGQDLRLAMLGILMSRHADRIPQRTLFEEEAEPEPSRPVRADAVIADRARVYLFHEFERPLFYGFDTLCDASSQNAERFLRLSEKLVDRCETHAIRGRSTTLNAGVQHDLLRERAEGIIKEWNFPMHREVKVLCDAIAKACLAKILEPTAPDGPTGAGILESEIPLIDAKHPQLARVLKYGVAYNAFSLQRDRSAKGERRCVIELSGLIVLKHGLTLQRGHFVPWDLDTLLAALPGE